MADYIRVQQIRSAIRRHYSQRLTLKSLGLNKIGRIVSVRFNGPMWGMIQKVRRLIAFPDQELFEAHRLVLPQPEDEDADKALLRQLLFKGEGVELVALQEKKTKTPDYKVMKNGDLKGYCELKSPRDDWIFAVPKDLRQGEIRKERREEGDDVPDRPAYKKLLSDGELDRCGVTLLAGKAVGAPFVGAVAACLAISEVLRLLHGGMLHQLIDLDLQSCEQRTLVRQTQRFDTFNPGYVSARRHRRPPDGSNFEEKSNEPGITRLTAGRKER